MSGCKADDASWHQLGARAQRSLARYSRITAFLCQPACRRRNPVGFSSRADYVHPLLLQLSFRSKLKYGLATSVDCNGRQQRPIRMSCDRKLTSTIVLKPNVLRCELTGCQYMQCVLSSRSAVCLLRQPAQWLVVLRSASRIQQTFAKVSSFPGIQHHQSAWRDHGRTKRTRRRTATYFILSAYVC